MSGVSLAARLASAAWPPRRVLSGPDRSGQSWASSAFGRGKRRTDRVAHWSEETSDGLLASIGSYLGTRAYG